MTSLSRSVLSLYFLLTLLFIFSMYFLSQPFLSTCFTQFLIRFLYLFSRFPFLSTLVLRLLVRCLFHTRLSFSNLTLFFSIFSFLLVTFSLYIFFYFFIHSTYLLFPLLPSYSYSTFSVHFFFTLAIIESWNQPKSVIYVKLL